MNSLLNLAKILIKINSNYSDKVLSLINRRLLLQTLHFKATNRIQLKENLYFQMKVYSLLYKRQIFKDYQVIILILILHLQITIILE